MKRLYLTLLDHFDDAMFLIGVLLICYGLWQIYPPVSWIFGGATLIFLALVNARYSRKAEL